MSSGQEVGEIFGRGSGPAATLLRSPTVLIASIGLWGMNVYFFRLFGINYIEILNLDLINQEEDDTAINHYSANDEGSTKMSSSPVSPVRHDVFAQCDENLDTLARQKQRQPELAELELGSLSLDNNKEMKNSLYPNGNVIHERKVSSSKPSSWDDESEFSNENYSEVFPLVKVAPQDHDSTSSEVTDAKLLIFSGCLMILLHFTSLVWINIFHGNAIGAIFVFYIVMFLAIVIPLQETRWVRLASGTIWRRTLALFKPRCSCLGLANPKAVPFIDVFFADAMCSLSKVRSIEFGSQLLKLPF